ncbi:MAG: gliding motility-associated C-terminal domain-containing protein, partial [Bacteroidota bacterium]
ATYQPTANTTETEIFRAASGCDSVRHLNFVIDDRSVTVDTTIILCPGNSFTTDRATYQPTANTTETEIFQAASGCDSIRNLNFVIDNRRVTVDTTITLCPGTSFTTAQNTYRPAANSRKIEVYRAASGCDSIRNLNFVVLPFLDPVVGARVDSTSCADATDGRIQLVEPNIQSSYQYFLAGNPVAAGTALTGLGTGTYPVALTYGSGCRVVAEIRVPGPAPITGTLRSVREEGTSLEAILDGGTPGYTYAWSVTGDNVTLGCTDCPTPTAEGDGSTTVRLTVTDARGCTFTDSLRLRVIMPRLHYAPTAFSPNDDGINDRFQIYGAAEAFTVEQLEIYDRWGGLVFRASSAAEAAAGWDGGDRGTGTYVWIGKIRWRDGNERSIQGIVELVR